MEHSFLGQVTSELIRERGIENLGTCTMVFPMHRAGLFVQQYIEQYMLQNGERRPIVLPEMTTIDALFDQLSQPGQEDEIVSVCRLYQAYKAHTSDTLSADAFYGWGNQLLTDFSNTDMALLDVRKLMRNSAEAAQLDEMLLDDEVRERLLHLLGSEGEAHSVRRFFTSLWHALPDIYDDFTHSQQEAGVGTRGARSRWVVEHFTEDRIQQRIQGRCFVFVGFNFLLPVERELMRLINSYTETRVFVDNENENENENNGKGVTAIACPSSAAQAQYVHEWLLANHHEGEKTAVVLADESLLQSVIYSLPRRSESPIFERVNVTKGYPLRQTQVYAQLVGMMENENDNDNDNENRLERLVERFADWYHHAARAEEESWQQVLTDEAYYQAQRVLREIRILLRDNDVVHELLDTPRLLMQVVRRRLESVSIPFHGEPITDLQIIGVLETRLLDFDNVLVLNVEEGVVPNTAIDHSFIPYDIRRAHGMRTREEEANIYRYNFLRLLRRAKTVTLTFSEAATEMGQKTMSRFLMQMLTDNHYDVERLRLTESADVIETESAEQAFTAEAYSVKRLSPSAISDYIECPREFYYKHIRHIHEAKTASVLFDISAFGQMVHATLEAYYRAESPITLSEALDVAYATTAKGEQRAHHEAENHVILRMAEAVITLDKKENPTILELEYPVRKPILLEGGTLSLEGKIDRLDKIGNTTRIVDYKTGSYDIQKMSFDSIEELFTNPKKRYALQTLIYASIVHEKQEVVTPCLYYPRQINSNPHLWYREAELTDYAAQIGEEFENALHEKLQEICAATEFPMAEPKQCEDSSCYCPFHLLCGRHKNIF